MVLWKEINRFDGNLERKVLAGTPFLYQYSHRRTHRKKTTSSIDTLLVNSQLT